MYYLTKYEIFSSDVDLEKLKSIVNNNNDKNETISVDLFQKLSNKKNDRQKVEVGLVQGFEMLFALNREHPVSKEYLTKKESLKQSLSSRNRSILAHGVDPVDKDKYEEMEGLVINFVQRLIPEIENRLDELSICFKADII
jgi:hypothetical protein